MTPEERFRALQSPDRWTVNSIEPRTNPFGAVKPSRFGQSWRVVLAEVALVGAVAAGVFGVIAVQNRADEPLSNDPPVPVMTSPAPTPEATLPPPVETPTPPPPAPPAAPVVKKIVVTTDGLQLLAKNGDVLDEFAYFADDWEQEGEDAIEALSDAFEQEPEVTPVESSPHFSAYFETDWDGFIIFDIGGGPTLKNDMAFMADVTARTVNGVRIETGDGVRIGTPLHEVEALAFEQNGDEPLAGNETGSYLLDRIELEGEAADAENEMMGDGFRAAYGTSIQVQEGDTEVSRILAPGRNFGP